MNPRVWVPIPAWWLRVWITVRGASTTGDALEQAIVDLVRAGCHTEAALRHALSLPPALVAGAVSALVGAGTLVADDAAKLTTGKLAADENGVRARRGWIAWDARHNRPLRQVWLDDLIPDAAAMIPPSGWDVLAPPEESNPPGQSPRWRELEMALRLLPSVGEVVLAERCGAQARLLDGAGVSRLRRAADVNPKRGFIWAPVEQRLSGPVVWRPAILPHLDLVGELDPGGLDQLETTPEGRATVASRSDSLRDGVAPGVLSKAGFATVEALRDAARREAECEFAGAWQHGGDELSEAVVEAYVTAVLARAAGGHARTEARGWADVLELATAQMMVHVRVVLRDGEPPGHISPERERELVKLLGPSWGHVKKLLGKPEECRDLRDACLRSVDTIGTRVLALGVAVVIDRPVRDAFGSATRETPDLMRWLDRALEERNLVIHPKPGQVVDAAGFRTRTIGVVAGLMRFGAAMGHP